VAYQIENVKRELNKTVISKMNYNEIGKY